MKHLKFTSYNLETGEITNSFSDFPQCGLPEGQDWIRGYVDGSRYRIDPETGKKYKFIDQGQLEYFIRKHAQKLRIEAGVNNVPALLTARELGEITSETYAELINKRRAIDACEKALRAMTPIPQSYKNARYWKCK